MNEDFVTFKQAKLLNEQGFDQECQYGYYIMKEGQKPVMSTMSIAKMCSGLDIQVYGAPTLAQVQKWLRESKQIEINSTYDPITKNGWFYYRNDLKAEIWGGLDHFGDDKYFDTYEAALSEGITHILKTLNK